MKRLFLHFTVDYQKCTQVLNFFSEKAGGQVNKMKALKLAFFADRYHLRKYGRFLTNDDYVAMRYGPVPSLVKDIAEANDYLDTAVKVYSQDYIDSIDNHTIRSIEKIDRRIFSESDLEALEFSWNTFGHYDKYQLKDISHQYPEWAKFKKILECSNTCYAIDPLDFLKDPPNGYDKCFELTEEEKAGLEEYIKESAYIDNLWSENAGCPA